MQPQKPITVNIYKNLIFTKNTLHERFKYKYEVKLTSNGKLIIDKVS